MTKTDAPRIIFITGTDTGVGKTLLTGLLVHHLRQSGCHALAMKPFASGSRADAEFLQEVQGRELTADEINPFFFAEPLAPLIAGRLHHHLVRLPEVVRCINGLANRCECLLIEGIGGVLVPLGEGYSVLDLVARLGCPTLVASRNRLGTINHTRLACAVLQHAGIKRLKVVLVSSLARDSSAESNRPILSELLTPVPVLPVPFLGRNAMRFGVLKASEKKLKKTLAQILA